MIGSSLPLPLPRPIARARCAVVITDSRPSCLDDMASNGHVMEVRPSGREPDLASRYDSNLLIVDGRVRNAIGIVRRARLDAGPLPIFFLATSIDDVAAAVAAGANDFALVSSSAAEIALRCQMLVNGSVRPVSTMRNVGGLQLDPRARTLSDGAHTVSLSPIELKMLERLLLHPGQPVSQSELRRSIWHDDELAKHPTNIAVVYVSYLRKKLSAFSTACRIRTITHAGYALELLPSNSERPSIRTR